MKKTIIFVLFALFFVISCGETNTGTGDGTNTANNDKNSDDDEVIKCISNLDCSGGYKCVNGRCVDEEDDNDYEITCPWKDSDTGYRWSAKTADHISWNNAISYCADLEEGGYNDWKLPTISELRTLIINCPATETGGICKGTDDCLSLEDCRNDPCDGCYTKKFFSKIEDVDSLWSSSERSDDTGDAWTVDFYHGNITTYNKFYDYLIKTRCVR